MIFLFRISGCRDFNLSDPPLFNIERATKQIDIVITHQQLVSCDIFCFSLKQLIYFYQFEVYWDTTIVQLRYNIVLCNDFFC